MADELIELGTPRAAKRTLLRRPFLAKGRLGQNEDAVRIAAFIDASLDLIAETAGVPKQLVLQGDSLALEAIASVATEMPSVDGLLANVIVAVETGVALPDAAQLEALAETFRGILGDDVSLDEATVRLAEQVPGLDVPEKEDMEIMAVVVPVGVAALIALSLV